MVVKKKPKKILVRDFNRIHSKSYKPKWSFAKGTWVMSKSKIGER